MSDATVTIAFSSDFAAEAFQARVEQLITTRQTGDSAEYAAAAVAELILTKAGGVFLHVPCRDFTEVKPSRQPSNT